MQIQLSCSQTPSDPRSTLNRHDLMPLGKTAPAGLYQLVWALLVSLALFVLYGMPLAYATEQRLLEGHGLSARVQGPSWCNFMATVTVGGSNESDFRPGNRKLQLFVDDLVKVVTARCLKARNLRVIGQISGQTVYVGFVRNVQKSTQVRGNYIRRSGRTQPRTQRQSRTSSSSNSGVVAEENRANSQRRTAGPLKPALGKKSQTTKGTSKVVQLSVVGVWKGQYFCAQGWTGVTLKITGGHPSQLRARFHFYPLNTDARGKSRVWPGFAKAEGEFELKGTYDSLTQELALRPSRWIKRPRGYRMLELKGLLDQRNQKIKGAVIFRGCGQFEVAKTQGDPQAPTVPIKTVPEVPTKLQSVVNARGFHAKCKALWIWGAQLGREYPKIDFYHTVMGKVYPLAANLFRDDLFVPVFGIPFDQTSRDFRSDIARHVMMPCSRDPAYADRLRPYHSFYSRPMMLKVGSFSYQEVASIVGKRRILSQWMQRVLQGVKNLDATEANFDRVDSYLQKGKRDLRDLKPSERKTFAADLMQKKKQLAQSILLTWGKKIQNLGGSLESARVISDGQTKHAKYIDVLPKSESAAIRSKVAEKLDGILSPIIDRELTELKSWPPTLAGAGKSVAWHNGFQRKFARFSSTPSFRAAEKVFLKRRNEVLVAATPEFVSKLKRTTLNNRGALEVRKLFTQTFPLRLDKTLTSYNEYRKTANRQLAMIHDRAIDDRVAAIIGRPTGTPPSHPREKNGPKAPSGDKNPYDRFQDSGKPPPKSPQRSEKGDPYDRFREPDTTPTQRSPRSEQQAGFPLNGYILRHLISNIYQKRYKVLPDDKKTRSMVAGLYTAFNRSCGESGSDVGFAAIKYIMPSTDKALMQGMKALTDLIQSGNYGAYARSQSRVAKEGVDDGNRLIGRHGCDSAQSQRFRRNLHGLILFRYRHQPGPYDERLFAALLSEQARRRYGYPDPTKPSKRWRSKSGADVTSMANTKRRRPRQTAKIQEIRENCNNIMLRSKGVCDAAAKCGPYFIYFHPQHRKGKYRYSNVYTVSRTAPDAKVQFIQESWSFHKRRGTLSKGKTISRGKKIARTAVKPLIYPQAFGDYYGGRQNICAPYRAGELSCSPNRTYCRER